MEGFVTAVAVILVVCGGLEFVWKHPRALLWLFCLLVVVYFNYLIWSR